MNALSFVANSRRRFIQLGEWKVLGLGPERHPSPYEPTGQVVSAAIVWTYTYDPRRAFVTNIR